MGSGEDGGESEREEKHASPPLSVVLATALRLFAHGLEECKEVPRVASAARVVDGSEIPDVEQVLARAAAQEELDGLEAPAVGRPVQEALARRRYS